MAKAAPRIGIIGGGLAGLTLSCLLGQAGFDVTCVDAVPLARQMEAGYDGRTTAISYGSRAVMKRAGVWDGLAGRSATIETIDILDGNSDFVLQFAAHEVEAEAFGWIVDNADLRRALVTRVQQIKNVTHTTGVSVASMDFGRDAASVTLADGKVVDFDLIVGADGRQSATREALRNGSWGRSYGQTALVCLVTHEQPHHGVAVEHFMPEGPFALLPFTDAADGRHRSALVWTVHGTDAEKWVECDESVFNAALQARSRGRFGQMQVAGKRAAWPLSLTKAYSYVGQRAVLVAEAAHGIHPIAGQGLNLGLRDLDTLATLLTEAREAGEDIASDKVLRRYQRARRFDNLAMTFATDGLTMLFSNDNSMVAAIRRIGLRGVAALPMAKGFFMRQAMGLAGKARV